MLKLKDTGGWLTNGGNLVELSDVSKLYKFFKYPANKFAFSESFCKGGLARIARCKPLQARVKNNLIGECFHAQIKVDMQTF